MNDARSWICLAALVGSACGAEGIGTETGETGAAIDDASCAVQYRWEPGAGDLSTFPTAELLVDDPTTTTGKRVRITAAEFPGVAEYGRHAELLTEQASALDGFGILGDVFLGFDGSFAPADLPVATAIASPDAPAGIVVMPLDGPAYLAPVKHELTDGRTTLVMHPLFPLPESTPVAVWVKRSFAAAGDCVGASPGMRAWLDEASDEPAVVALRSLDVVADTDELAALHIFPTQSATEQSRAVAAYVDGLPDDGRFALTGHTCVPSGPNTYCTSQLSASDFRDAGGVVPFAPGSAVTPQADWELVVHAWLPGDGTAGPYPTALHLHGLTQSGDYGDRAAERLNPLGIAVVSVSAVLHGDHPSVSEPSVGLAATLAFFAIDIDTGTLDALRLRDHFRQSTYDKLFVVRALQAGADLDGDGTGDVDPQQLVFSGVSLGGVMGPELLALSDAFGAAVVNIAGGRLVLALNSPGSAFEVVSDVLFPSEFSAGTKRRTYAIVQSIIDAADPATYAPAIIKDRFSGADGVHLLMTVVLNDGTMPNEASWALFRAAGVPVVLPELEPIVGVPTTTAAPVSANVDGVTAGLLQFDVIDAEGTGASHFSSVFTDVGAEAWTTFFDSYFREGTPEIIDPYAALGIPHRD